jgi:ABC-type uncharacterized transport system substrate-binding protein
MKTILKCNLVFWAFISIFLIAAGCSGPAKPTIFYINSYHSGYASSDDVMMGIQETLKSKDVQLEIFFMDTKRHSDTENIRQKAKEVVNKIKKVKPAVIIASDDNAVKYVVAPNFKKGPIPCVFCGVNWSCEQYGLPRENVTGMLEVLPIRETIKTIQKYYPNSKRLAVLSENTTSEQKNKEILSPLYIKLGLKTKYALVDNYQQWKKVFIAANKSADIIYLPTNGAVKGWKNSDAIAFVKEQIRVPVFTCDDFMMPYAVFGLTKVSEEQGQWAAKTAIEIMKGKSPKDIAVTENKQTKAYLNSVLAEKVGFKPEAELLRRCKKIN